MNTDQATNAASRGSALSEGLGPLPERWYCVGNDGRATLCTGEADARDEVTRQDAEYPRTAPHRAMVLGDVAAERERCARLADEYATWGGSNFHAWFKKLAAAIRA